MDLFDIIIVAFTALVLISILLGTIGICVKCSQVRKRRRLGPVDDAEREQQQEEIPQFGKWPDMTGALKQQQQTRVQEQQELDVQPIAGIIVVRPSFPAPVQPQMEIERAEPGNSRAHRNLVHQNTTSSESTSAGHSRRRHDTQMHEMMEVRESSSSSSANTVALGQQQHIDSEKGPPMESQLEKANEFKSTILISEANEAENERKKEEEAEEDTARRIEKEKVDGDSESVISEGQKTDDEKRRLEEAEAESGDEEEEEEKRETKAEVEERKMLGATEEDLPEDKEAELQEKEAYRRPLDPRNRKSVDLPAESAVCH